MNHNQQPNQLLKYLKEHYQPLLIGISVGLIVGFTGGFFSQPYIVTLREAPQSESSGEVELTVTEITEAPMTGDNIEEVLTKQLCVDVSGAVMAPGVYCLDEGEMVVNAILKAGDINYDAYAFQYVSKYINYARKVRPNEKIYIPFAEEFSCTAKKFEFAEDVPMDDDLVATVYKGGTAKDVASGGGVAAVQGGSGNGVDSEYNSNCVNINSATIDELDTLPGIGPVTAQNIIDARPFSSIEQLLDVTGIGESKYNQIKDLVCI